MNIEISLKQVNFVIAWLMGLLIILETHHHHEQLPWARAAAVGNREQRLWSESAPSLLHQYLQSPDTDTEQSETNSTNISWRSSHVENRVLPNMNILSRGLIAKSRSYSQYSIQSWSFWKRKMLCKFNIEQQFRSQSAVDQGRGIDEQRILNTLCLGLTLVKTLQAGDKTMTKFQSHKMLEHN
mgnify:CR=1 FL=1